MWTDERRSLAPAMCIAHLQGTQAGVIKTARSLNSARSKITSASWNTSENRLGVELAVGLDGRMHEAFYGLVAR